MPQLMCALGLLIGAAGGNWSSISERAVRTASLATNSLKEARGRIERAILAPQVSAVDLLMVAIADEALDDIRFAAPERWRKTEQTPLTDTELAAIRLRLGLIAKAGHAAALGHYEIVLRPGEHLGLSTHLPVKLAERSAAGDIIVADALMSTLPTLQLDRLDMFGQQLSLNVQMSMTPKSGGGRKTSTFRMEPLKVRAGDSLMVIVKNPFPIDRRLAEKAAPETLSLDRQHRLLLMTPGRQPRPKTNGQIARNLGMPTL